MHDCVVALGSNLGDRSKNLDEAIKRLDSHPAIRVIKRSAWHRTTPIGGPPEQPSFLNGAVRLKTRLVASSIFGEMQKIEHDLGRQRDVRWGARTIDLDLLVFDQEILDDPRLSLPHPRMAFRRFVLMPAVEIAADVIHPTTGWTFGQLYENLLRRPRYIALAGPIGIDRTSLARQLKQRLAMALVVETLHDDLQNDHFHDPLRLSRNTESKLLPQRANNLESHRFKKTDAVIVSDYWLGQTYVLAQLELDAQDWRKFRSQWQEVSQDVISPSLVVLLDAPTNVLLSRIEQRDRADQSGETSEWLNRLRRNLDRQIRSPATGPFLRIDTTRTNALDEIVAAVLAMFS